VPDRGCALETTDASPHFQPFTQPVGVPIPKLPGLSLVLEWGKAHQMELQENWTQMAIAGTFNPIEPLV
jgi:hypothetical protein